MRWLRAVDFGTFLLIFIGKMLFSICGRRPSFDLRTHVVAGAHYYHALGMRTLGFGLPYELTLVMSPGQMLLLARTRVHVANRVEFL